MEKHGDYQRAYALFLSDYQEYSKTHHVDEIRRLQFTRLHESGQIYLDYTGGGLYAQSQLDEHMALLRNNVFGNPHSNNPTSLLMTTLVESARAAVLNYFKASPEEYVVIFTANATGALKLVGESYPFAEGGHLAISTDNHNSVNGLREFAQSGGASVDYIPLTVPELRLDPEQLKQILYRENSDQSKLFAFPAQSNYSGVQHPLTLIEEAQSQGWDVLLDSAAFVPTNRLDLSKWHPDFVTISFYKMFGYPTGVGALIARRSALSKLRRPWFAGGTIRLASISTRGHYFIDGEAAFEDGTVNYLSLPAVEIGLRHIEAMGLDAIHTRVKCLTEWLLRQLVNKHHSNGMPIVRIHGPLSSQMRGGTITMSFFDAEGIPITGQLVEKMASDDKISLRSGCFCNPGAGETTFLLPHTIMKQFFDRAEDLKFPEFVRALYEEQGVDISGIRTSVGMASNFADVYQFMLFVGKFADKKVSEFLDTLSSSLVCPNGLTGSEHERHNGLE